MKKLILLACLLAVSVPLASRAQNGQGDNCQGQEPTCTPTRISATEMGAIGSGVAVFLGVAGYLVLRRRRAV